ncbi:MAG: hypothetical protein EA359_07510 [Balneolaceae bacterium]|nr:MAG: hypothetical protein EA359_07510 [Balneolaceae bacterium]
MVLFPGDAIVTVSGSVDADYSGDATAYELHFRGDNTWTISLRDPDSELFSVLLSINTAQRVYWPGPGAGEYEIGTGELDTGTFSATYYNIQAGVTYDPDTGEVLKPIPTYSTNTGYDAGGHLVIEEESEGVIEGSFQFKAYRVTEPSPDDVITVEGRFSALRH